MNSLPIVVKEYNIVMKRIVLSLFAILVLPYLGIPNVYDTWILLSLFVFIAYTLYSISKQYDVHKEFVAWVKELAFSAEGTERKMMHRSRTHMSPRSIRREKTN